MCNVAIVKLQDNDKWIIDSCRSVSIVLVVCITRVIGISVIGRCRIYVGICCRVITISIIDSCGFCLSRHTGFVATVQVGCDSISAKSTINIAAVAVVGERVSAVFAVDIAAVAVVGISTIAIVNIATVTVVGRIRVC